MHAWAEAFSDQLAVDFYFSYGAMTGFSNFTFTFHVLILTLTMALTFELGMLTRLEILESRSFFSILGNEFRLPRIETSDPQQQTYCERIIVTCRSTLAIGWSWLASPRPWTAYQTHGRTPRNKGQWRMVGDRCFCRRTLITIVRPTPLRRPGSANTAASVWLYIGNKKDHCSEHTHTDHRTPVAVSRHILC